MTELRQSIRPILTDIPLRRILAEDFPRDCANLPISRGWGYAKSEAIIFVRSQFPIPEIADFVGLEYHISQKITYEELIIYRDKDNRFSGIELKLESQHLMDDADKKYDLLNFTISCWSDSHWESLKKEWEDNDYGRRPGFDVKGHEEKRATSQIRYERQFWFDITDVFGRN